MPLSSPTIYSYDRMPDHATYAFAAVDAHVDWGPPSPLFPCDTPQILTVPNSARATHCDAVLIT